MVSVVIPLYNKERTIRRCVRSVLNQTYKDLEILIVDDGSTDKSIKQLATFSDSRIKIIKTHHQGVSVARNIGIRQSLGEFVALIDADDEWDLEFLETLLSLSEKYPQASVFISRYRFCDNEGISLDAVIRGLNYANDGIVYDYFKIASDSNPPICSSNILAYKWVFEDAGFFPNEIEHGEDLALWAKIACRNTIVYSAKTLSTYNITRYPVGAGNVYTPKEYDDVYEELCKLLIEYHHKSIKLYIAQTKKMLVATLTRNGYNKRAIKESILGLKYNPIKFKLYLYLIFNIFHLPPCWIDRMAIIIQRTKYNKI